MGTQRSTLVRDSDLDLIADMFALSAITMSLAEDRNLKSDFLLVPRKAQFQSSKAFTSELRTYLNDRAVELRDVLGVTAKAEIEVLSKQPTRFAQLSRQLWQEVADSLMAVPAVREASEVFFALTRQTWTIEVPVIVIHNVSRWPREISVEGKATVNIVPTPDTAAKSMRQASILESRTDALPPEVADVLLPEGEELEIQGFPVPSSARIESVVAEIQDVIFESAVFAIRNLSSRMPQT